MKKIIALLLALIMIVSAVALTACGDENETEAPTEAPTEPQPVVKDVPFDYAGGFNRVLLGLADALPVSAFCIRQQD